MSQFCIITPTAYLDQYASQSSMHLVLAHLVDHDETYCEFYKNRTEFKIMDTSAFELGYAYKPEKMIELGTKVGADVLVLPDYPNTAVNVTINAAEEYIPQYKNAGFGTFFCPQAFKGDLEGLIDSYVWGTNNPDVDIIGISILNAVNALPNLSPVVARIVFTQILLERGLFRFDKPHHYLGLISPGIELPNLLSMGVLTSCDSSSPVWFGALGHQYSKMNDGWLPVSKNYIPEVNFDHPMTHHPQVHGIIQRNVDMILREFG